MQTSFLSNLFARRPAQQTELTQQAEAAPVELKTAELEQVAGGVTVPGPNGSWSSDVSWGPNGSW